MDRAAALTAPLARSRYVHARPSDASYVADGRNGMPQRPDRNGDDDWIRALGPTSDVRARLFCLPYAGGGPATFRPWLKHLPSGMQLCCLELPGRESRILEKPLNDIHRLIAHIQASILTRLDRPYMIFGHSFGAIVGFELLQNLAAGGYPPPALFMASGAAAPHLQQQLGVSDLPDDAFIDFLGKCAGAPAALFDNPELLELALPALRADFEITDRYCYAPRPRLTCPIVALAGDCDPLVNASDLAAWQDHTSGAFRAYRPAGNHLYLRADNEAFFTLLRAELDAACLMPASPS
jgi:surfactin synthase thioesterase subunit